MLLVRIALFALSVIIFKYRVELCNSGGTAAIIIFIFVVIFIYIIMPARF